MKIIEVTLKLDSKEFPMLKNFKKKELDNLLILLLKTGYQIHFPPKDKIEQNIEIKQVIERIENMRNELKDDIINSDISDKITSLESNLSKLIAISSNSTKKGAFGEYILEEIFNTRFGDIKFERKGKVAHSGDAWLYLPDDKVIMLESKNYTTTVNKDEIIKMQNDMVTHHIKWGILVSFNSQIQGMKELDLHNFNHNNESYFVIMISNLSNDFHKLDLGIQIIRKLITNFDNLNEFPWVVTDINQNLSELNQIVQKNYLLRDSFYSMERDIQRSLSNYHVILRDYQFEIEQKINLIIDKIKSTINDSTIKNKIDNILTFYQDKKIIPLIVRIIDIAQNKKWDVTFDEKIKDLIFIFNKKEICKVKILKSKITIEIPKNDLVLNLNIGKDKENKQNLEIINSL